MKEVRIEKTANMITEAFKKASEDAKKTVDALMTDDAKKKLDVLESLEANEKNDDLRDEKSETVKVPTPHEKAAEKLKQAARELYKEHSDIEILRAELKDARHDLDSAYREIEDLRKTISKMQQHHEAEVQDLKDQLGETQAALAVAEKSKTEACRERNELIDAAEDDDDRLQEILALAVVLERGARSMQELSRMLQEKTER